MGVADLTLSNMVERSAILYANKTALVEAERRITYLQLKKMVDSCAAGLLKKRVNTGDRIGVLAVNSVEYLLLYLAAAQVGAILVPINFRLSPEEIAFIIEDTNPVLLFVHPKFQAILQSLGGRLSCVSSFYSTGQPTGSFIGFEELMEGEEIRYDRRSDIGWHSPIVIFYTAATSGSPRGAVLTQGNIIASNAQLSSTEGLSFSGSDSFLAFLTFSHVYGLIATMGILQVGGVNVIQTRFDAEEAVELINREKVTVFFSFAPILESILDVVEKKNVPLPHLRLVSGLEGPENIQRLQNLTHAKFWGTYGQGETTGPVTFCPFDNRSGSAGRCAPLAHIELVDAYDNPVPAGNRGEIVVRGPLVFKGYWGLAEDTNYTFREEWHHTGDLGEFDKDGYLFYRGRTAEKELIKTGGENVYPAEVEKTVLIHPSIYEAVVFGVPHPKWGEGIKLVCVLKPGETVGREELIEFVGSQIARYKKPHFVTFVDHLPKTACGKIDREKVKAEHRRV